MNYACDGMVQPSVNLFLVPTLPLLPSYIVIKNNFGFLKFLFFFFILPLGRKYLRFLPNKYYFQTQ